MRSWIKSIANKLGIGKRELPAPKPEPAAVSGYCTPKRTKRVRSRTRRAGKLPKPIFGARICRRERWLVLASIPRHGFGPARYAAAIRGKCKAQGEYRVPRSH